MQLEIKLYIGEQGMKGRAPGGGGRLGRQPAGGPPPPELLKKKGVSVVKRSEESRGEQEAGGSRHGNGVREPFWCVMGSSTSRPDVAGYRVMRVELNSPASTAADAAELPWVPYLDVLTHAGGVDLSQDPTVLTSQLQEHIGRELVLTVVNAKSKLQREITVRFECAVDARKLYLGPALFLPPREIAAFRRKNAHPLLYIFAHCSCR